MTFWRPSGASGREWFECITPSDKAEYNLSTSAEQRRVQLDASLELSNYFRRAGGTERAQGRYGHATKPSGRREGTRG